MPAIVPVISFKRKFVFPVISFKRKFVFKEGNSNKFWNITVYKDFPYYTVNFGRVGYIGQQRHLEFKTPRVAYLAALAKIREKIHKGYKEVGAHIDLESDISAKDIALIMEGM